MPLYPDTIVVEYFLGVIDCLRWLNYGSGGSCYWYTTGCATGCATGYDTGYDVGYDTGYDIGYVTGSVTMMGLLYWKFTEGWKYALIWVLYSASAKGLLIVIMSIT